MQCYFCKKQTNDPVEDGFVPDFCDGDQSISEPVCPDCQAIYIRTLPGGDRIKVDRYEINRQDQDYIDAFREQGDMSGPFFS